MRRLLVLIIIFSPVCNSSCCQIAESIAKGVAEGLSESLGELIATHVATQFISLALTVEVFYLENDKWPSSQKELVDFCFQNKWDDPGNYWKSCNDFDLKKFDDGSLEINFTITAQQSDGTSTTIPSCLKISKPSGDKKVARQELNEFLIKKKHIDKAVQETF
jgi:hypothetical protein